MSDLLHYMEDGADYQSRAVMCMLQGLLMDGIEESWDKKYHRYGAEPKIDRWHNCREQGYIVSLHTYGDDQLNIAFFQHRSSDSIYAVKWMQWETNPITIDNAEFTETYDGYNASFVVKQGEILKMAEWVHNELVEYYKTTKDYARVQESNKEYEKSIV